MALSWDSSHSISNKKLAAFVQYNFEGDFTSWKREYYVKFMEESGLPPSVFYSNGSGPPSADDSKGIVSQRKSTVEILIRELNKTTSVVQKLAGKMDDLYAEQEEQKSMKNTSKAIAIGLNTVTTAAGAVACFALPPAAPVILPVAISAGSAAVGLVGAGVSLHAEWVDKKAAQRYKEVAQKILADYQADWENRLTSVLKDIQKGAEYLKSTKGVPSYMALYAALANPHEVELTEEFFQGFQRSLDSRDGGLTFFDGASSSGSRVVMKARNLRESLRSLEATLLPDNFFAKLGEVSGLLIEVAGVVSRVTGSAAGIVAAVAERRADEVVRVGKDVFNAAKNVGVTTAKTGVGVADDVVTAVGKDVLNVAKNAGVTTAKVVGGVCVVLSLLAIVADVVNLIKNWDTSPTMDSARKIRNHFLERADDLRSLLADLRIVQNRIHLSQRPMPN